MDSAKSRGAVVDKAAGVSLKKLVQQSHHKKHGGQKYDSRGWSDDCGGRWLDFCSMVLLMMSLWLAFVHDRRRLVCFGAERALLV